MKPHPVFLPLSWIYGALVWLRNLFFDIGVVRQTKLQVPVISVGNITAGGTGKTPIVKNIAQILIESGKKIAIISRGYGRTSKGFRIVSDGQNIVSTVEEAGDEPFYLAQQLKNAIVIVDEQRVRGSQKAIEQFGAHVILLDDGFQHRYLYRDTDIVLVDSERSLYESKILPAGYRRESVSSIRRADAVVVTKSGKEKRGIKNIAERKTFSSSYEPIGLRSVFGDSRITIDSLAGKKISAFCGIAKPESFMNTLNGFVQDIVCFSSFPDHYHYSLNDIQKVIEESKKNIADFILTTEKDAVKIKKFKKEYSDIPLFAVEMDAQVYPEAEWKAWIVKQVER